jgi:phosphatidate cytidylyltransferase
VLKERVLTAIVLVTVLLGVMLGLPPLATVWLVTVLVLIGAWEWAGFIGKGQVPLRIGFTSVIALLLLGCLQVYSTSPGLVPVIMWVAVAWWFLALLWISLAPSHVNPVTATLAGILSLVPCWLALVYLTISTHSTHWVLFTLALVWAADTGAFFAGRWLGRVPLAPRVSPKKTWEGVLGGMVASGLVAWAAATWLFAIEWWPFVATCVAVAALSIVGDLTESMLKRAAGLKDSGTLFPGHGGMLDRIDSVTAAAPALLCALLGLRVLA